MPRVAARTDYVDPPSAQTSDALDTPTTATREPVEAAPAKPAEKPAVVKPAEKPAETEPPAKSVVEKKPVTEKKPTVEKHVPSAKEIKAAKAQEEVRRPRRTVRDMRHEFEDEQPAVYMRRHGWFSERPRFAREWGMGGGFGRGGFGRMMGMGF
jgi:hypothetical protein